MLWHYGMWDYGCALSHGPGSLKGGAKSALNGAPNSSPNQATNDRPNSGTQEGRASPSHPKQASQGTWLDQPTLKTPSQASCAHTSPSKTDPSRATNAPKPLADPLADALVDPWADPLFVNQDKKVALEALRQAMESVACPSLTDTANRLVLGDGHPHSAIMIIGEAPGAEEDEQGLPFVGASGRLLESMLASIHLARQQVYMTNVIPWRPPFNRPPTSEEIKLFSPWLGRHIAIIQPRFLLCVGASATKAVLKLTIPLMNTQGTEYTYQCPHTHQSIPAWTLYHPAYLLRVPGQKKTAWIQLQHIEQVLHDRGIHPTPRVSLAQVADE